jgi:hypothetical protein
MTRKDYIKLAAALSAVNPQGRYDDQQNAMRTEEQWLRGVIAVAQVLQDDNPRFNYPMFMKAAGV